MEKVGEDKERYRVVGAKGGSTAFVLNQSMYVETLEGKHVVLVLFMDDLSIWQSIRMQMQTDNFIMEMINMEMINKERFLDGAKQRLQNEH